MMKDTLTVFRTTLHTLCRHFWTGTFSIPDSSDFTQSCKLDTLQTFQAEFLEHTQLAVLLLLRCPGVEAVRNLIVKPEVSSLLPGLLPGLLPEGEGGQHLQES